MGPDGSVLLLGVAFCLVYLAFNGSQNLLSSGDDKLGPFALGSWALGGLYLSNTISGLCLAVPACSWSTDRNTLIIWMWAVPIFVIANVVYPEYTLLPASILVGFSSGVQWTAAWSYIRSCLALKQTLKHASLLMGVFYGAMQSSQIFGNVLSSVFLHHVGHGKVYLGIFYAVSCVLGIGLLFILPNLGHKQEEAPIALRKKLLGMASLITRDPRMALMVLMFVYSGYTQTYFFGVFTQWISDERGGSDEDIGYVMAWFGASDALFSFILGWMGSQAGGLAVVLPSSACCVGGISFLWAKNGHHTMLTLSCVAWLFGVADAGYNSIITATLTRLFPKAKEGQPPGSPNSDPLPENNDSTCAFAAFQAFQSGTTAVGFFITSAISKYTQTYIFSGTLFLAICAYVVLSLVYLPHFVGGTTDGVAGAEEDEGASSSDEGARVPETQGLLQDA